MTKIINHEGRRKRKTVKEKTYDSVFWTAVVKLRRFLPALINEAFGIKLSDKTDVILKAGKKVIKTPEDVYGRRIMDVLAELYDPEIGGEPYDFHLECQTSGSDMHLSIRMAEYAAGYAYENISFEKETKRAMHFLPKELMGVSGKQTEDMDANIVLPHSAVILLRASKKRKDYLKIGVSYPGYYGYYTIPVIKIRDYSLTEMFEKNLYLLLPFYVFHYSDHRLANMEKMLAEGRTRDAAEKELYTESLVNTLEEINMQLDKKVEEGIITPEEKWDIAYLTEHVSLRLTEKYYHLQKGVKRIMGGTYIMTPADKCRKEGREEGKEELIFGLIYKKFKKQKTISQISEEIEEDVETIEPFYNIIAAFKEDYSIEEAYQKYASAKRGRSLSE